MPEATPFNALGVGNGFPSCLTKVDVSGYDYWTTLSGVSKDSPVASDALIAESLQLGMKLYWNLFSCIAPTDSSFTGPSGNTASAVSYLDVSLDSRSEPYKRVCGRVRASEEDNNGSSSAQLYINFSGGNFVIRMYNGAITDEVNFVGYGAFGTTILTRGNASGRADSQVFIQGYLDEVVTSDAISYAYVELSDMHFVCRARADGNVTQSADAVNLTASATSTLSSNSYASTSTITSLDFYTYPA